MADTATVIVALPRVDDRVNKISSEKIAHLTLCYLGDAQLSADAMLYVQHACQELSPFGLSVDYRGTLGVDDADVIFFEDNAWDLKRVKEFRHYLLLNEEIKKAYDNAAQFEEWTPHLTLGYPATPANEDEEDKRLYYVDFDRIAIWTGNFEGPEFRLKYADHGNSDAVGWSEIATAGAEAVGEMFHYGVKGMKWGVTTKDRALQVTQTREKKALRNTKDVTVSQRKAGTYVKTKGGQRQKADEDAVKAHAARQVAKKSTTDALSNKELKSSIERMRLEQEFKKLDSKTKRKGEGFISKLFNTPEGRATAADLLKQINAASN